MADIKKDAALAMRNLPSLPAPENGYTNFAVKSDGKAYLRRGASREVQLLEMEDVNGTFMKSWNLVCGGGEYRIFDGSSGEAYNGVEFSNEGDIEHQPASNSDNQLMITSYISKTALQNIISEVSANIQMPRANKVIAHVPYQVNTPASTGLQTLHSTVVEPILTTDGDTITFVYSVYQTSSPVSNAYYQFMINGFNAFSTSSLGSLAGGYHKIVVEVTRVAYNGFSGSLSAFINADTKVFCRRITLSSINFNNNTTFILYGNQPSATSLYNLYGGYVEFKPFVANVTEGRT